MSIELYTTYRSQNGYMSISPCYPSSWPCQKTLKYTPPCPTPGADQSFEFRATIGKGCLFYTYKICIIKSFEMQFRIATKSERRQYLEA
ncbi:hypothetical protein EMIT0P74_10305 [Pseudomonas sp. IT-P74]